MWTWTAGDVSSLTRRSMAKLIQRAAHGGVKRSVDIDQGPVQIEEDRLEFA